MSKPSKNKKGEPIDPDELSRRLQTYLTQQKMRVEERKQRAAYKAAHGHSPPNGRYSSTKKHNTQNLQPVAQPEESKESKSRPNSFGAEKENNGYHHVPSQAATQFQRTTTQDPLRSIHALSQPAVQYHLEQVKVPDTTNRASMQVINNLQAERAAIRNRNQFQLTKSMEEVNLIDDARGVHGPEYEKMRRSFLAEDDETPVLAQRPKSKIVLDMSGRDKWAQEDEKTKEAVIKRKPSSWIMLRKKSFRVDKDEAVSGVGGPLSPSSSEGKSAKNFLSRFKRHGS